MSSPAERSSSSPASTSLNSQSLPTTNFELKDSIHDFPEEKHDMENLTMGYMKKFEKYKADYTRRLMWKYFSTKNVHGGNIFDEKISIGDQTIFSSRCACTRSFADPFNSVEEQNSSGSASASNQTPE